jgi:hypothetical protein
MQKQSVKKELIDHLRPANTQGDLTVIQDCVTKEGSENKLKYHSSLKIRSLISLILLIVFSLLLLLIPLSTGEAQTSE